jgi:hypothetical protein
LQFHFDGEVLLPRLYIATLEKTGHEIAGAMRLHLSRVPPSVRILLAGISRLTLRVCGLPLSGTDLANLFFVVAVFLPAIKTPSFIGVDTDPSYALDDLAHLFFFSNFKSLVPPPPLVMPMLKIVGRTTFSFSEMIGHLIRSSELPAREYSSELLEEHFLQVIPGYVKLAQFMPIDLNTLHTAAIVVAQKDRSMLNANTIAQLDYLLGSPPGLDRTQQYDVFALELVLPSIPPPVLPALSLPAHVNDCFTTLFRSVDAPLFEAAPINNSVLFAGRARPALANASIVCEMNSSSVCNFLATEVQRASFSRHMRASHAVDARLASAELDRAFQRTERLSRTVFCAASKRLIRLLGRSHLFLELTQVPEGAKFFVQRLDYFTSFANHLLRKFWHGIESRHTHVHTLRASLYASYLTRITYCYIVNEIPITRFIEARRDIQDWIQGVMATDSLVPLHRLGQQAHRHMAHARILESQVEVICEAMNRDHCGAMLHVALRTVEIVANSIKCTGEGQYETTMQMAICWIVTHGDIDRFINWVYFMGHFFPQRKNLVDIIGGLGPKNWHYFEDVFRLIRTPGG